MNRAMLGAVIVIAAAIVAGFGYMIMRTQTPPSIDLSGAAPLSVTSKAFPDGTLIPSQYTCDGDDTSPALDISGIPASAKTLLLIMDDPDSPTGTWTHWLVADIPTNASPSLSFAAGSEPNGTPGLNSWNKTGYGGPCPGQGSHRYYFRVYAISETLGLQSGFTKTEAETALARNDNQILAAGILMGRYQRIQK